MKRPNTRPDADDPGLGGVPEQGLRVPRCDHCNREMVLLWACDDKHSMVYRLATAERAALERPRPALPAPTGDAVLDLLESAAKALRDVTVFTKGGGALMRELLASLRAPQGGPWIAKQSGRDWIVVAPSLQDMPGTSCWQADDFAPREQAEAVRDALNRVAGSGAETPPQPGPENRTRSYPEFEASLKKEKP